MAPERPGNAGISPPKVSASTFAGLTGETWASWHVVPNPRRAVGLRRFPHRIRAPWHDASEGIGAPRASGGTLRFGRLYAAALGGFDGAIRPSRHRPLVRNCPAASRRVIIALGARHHVDGRHLPGCRLRQPEGEGVLVRHRTDAAAGLRRVLGDGGHLPGWRRHARDLVPGVPERARTMPGCARTGVGCAAGAARSATSRTAAGDPDLGRPRHPAGCRAATIAGSSGARRAARDAPHLHREADLVAERGAVRQTLAHGTYCTAATASTMPSPYRPLLAMVPSQIALKSAGRSSSE